MADAKGEGSGTFKNRIIGYGTKPADQFQAHPDNWRRHPQEQRDAMRAALTELGWIGVVVENVRTGYLVDGHERVWEALQNGNAEVPFVQVDISEEEEAYALATFDPIGQMALADKAALDAVLRQVETESAAIQQLVAQTAERAGMYLDYTSTDRDGQGVSTTWDMVKDSGRQRVTIGSIEAVVPEDVVDSVVSYAERQYEADGTPVSESVTMILKAGVDAVICDS